MNLKRVWSVPTGRSTRPEFVSTGLALDKISFAYRNIRGQGANTKVKAVINWISEVLTQLKK